MRRPTLIPAVETKKGQALYAMWAFKEGREARYVLPYSCVEVSVKEGKRLTPIFVENGKPLEIHIHRSVSEKKKNKIIERIYVCAPSPGSFWRSK